MNTKIIYSAIVGSTMHGLRTENSDEDIRYITMPSLREIISPFKNDEVKVRNNKGEDEESWDLAHFCKHLTQGNPTVYEVIRTDHYDKSLPYAETVRSLMPLAFDGKRILMAHVGYCDSQIKRYLVKAHDDFFKNYEDEHEPDAHDVNGYPVFYYSFDSYLAKEIMDSSSNKYLNEIWEENVIRRIPKTVVAGYRVLAQCRQLLESGNFEPVVKNYSNELHDKLMGIKTMDSSKITWGFVREHIEGLENGIKELKAFYETLPDTIKHKKPDVNGIENLLCDIYGVK
jgi:predicted nucleotidyltransferase